MLGLLGVVRPRWPHLPLERSRQAGLDILATSSSELLTQTGRRHLAASPVTYGQALTYEELIEADYLAAERLDLRACYEVRLHQEHPEGPHGRPTAAAAVTGVSATEVLEVRV